MSKKMLFILGNLINSLNILLAIYFFNALPDKMITHVNFDNVPNGYMSKTSFLIFYPLFFIIIFSLSFFITIKDPRNANQEKKPLYFLFIAIPILGVIVFIALIRFNLGQATDIGLIISIAVGLLFIILGNYLPKIKPNYTFGIKLPWTLANEEVWQKTHRLSGYLWIMAGIIMMASYFISPNAYVFLGVLIIPLLVVPTIYAYRLYHKLEKGQ